MSSLPKPICAKCGRKVDRLDLPKFYPNQQLMRITAHCHGKIEHTDFFVQELVTNQIKIVGAGVAFND